METTNNFKPILFSTEMVQAILAGRKTQTRRNIKNLKGIDHNNFIPGDRSFLKSKGFQQLILRGDFKKAITLKPKYLTGDILWVRETFCDVSHNLENENCFLYKADFLGTTAELVKWKPSLFMPKEAARIFLKVTNVRCERLQDISEEDAISEGAKDSLNHDDMKLLSNLDWVIKRPFGNHQFGFLALWQSINAKKHPWKSNPWVWVYEFERIEKTENINNQNINNQNL